MKLYRFSPIDNKEQLFDAVKYTHFACYKLCKQSFGKYLPNAGNIGIFCHYADEHAKLVKIREELTEPSDDPNQKYFKLYIDALGYVSTNVMSEKVRTKLSEETTL